MAMLQLDRIREIAFALPSVTERVSHRAPCFYVRKKPIGRFHDADYAGDGRISLWCPAVSGAREELVAADPERFFAPTPSASGVFGDWIGVYLDTGAGSAAEWQEIAAVVEEAYRIQAPKSLIAKLNQSPESDTKR